MPEQRYGIGTAALAVPYGPPGEQRAAPDASSALRTLAAAAARGLRFVDTAPAYGDAELLVGAALGACADCVIATKLAIPAGGWHLLSPGTTRAHVRASAEASLRALRRTRLDVLQVHNADEQLIRRGAVADALAELQAAGLVARAGATVYGESAALAAIDCPVFELVQVAYSVLDRRAEQRVLPTAARAGTSVIARSLLLHGVLSPAALTLDVNGPFAPLRHAAGAVRVALGASWEELPGAAAAFAASRPGISCALLGPRNETELTALLDQAERFAVAAASFALPAPQLAAELLDPSQWPQEAHVGG
ncbi:MAG TPA: aldo/keto reductase [Solirubrobacteraceae bacterium]|nr:aldo/keto reductase [Solirubrobacteraceae bacterium]